MELTECSSQVVCHRRITMDPNGDCTSNATMMQGLVHVSTTGLPMFNSNALKTAASEIAVQSSSLSKCLSSIQTSLPPRVTPPNRTLQHV
eukprot:scaffold14970_cov421-Alexandrium_tamarense.AAC.1